MSVSLTLDESQVFTALGNFLTAVLPQGTTVLQGQLNRVAEPATLNFVVMWDILKGRIETNVDSYVDAVFQGSISGTELTITEVFSGFSGQIEVGSTIFGTGVAGGTEVTELGSGTGGVGTYTVNNSQIVGSKTLAAGTSELLQPTEVTMQVDVHGPASADNTQIITTLFRDEFATSFFAAQSGDITPLYADDARQVPFINAEKQYETRWIIDLHLQTNPVVVVSQQFASAVTVVTKNVDALYPP